MNTFSEAGLFLIHTIFGLYLTIVMVRLILQWLHADYYNPLSQFVIKLTNPIVLPLRKILPTLPKIDLATLILLLVLQLFELLLLLWLQFGMIMPNILGLFLWAIANIFDLLLTLYLYAILAVIIMSWLNPMSHNPIIGILYLFTEPLLRPARQFIPPIAGLDLSPIAVIILLKLIDIIFIKPLLKLGVAMTL